LLGEMCQNFKSNAPVLLAEVIDALRDHDAARLREAAHKLYGTITAFSNPLKRCKRNRATFTPANPSRKCPDNEVLTR